MPPFESRTCDAKQTMYTLATDTSPTTNYAIDVWIRSDCSTTHLPRNRFAVRAHLPIQILMQSIDLVEPHRESISSALPNWIVWRASRWQINTPQICFAQTNPSFSLNMPMILTKSICVDLFCWLSPEQMASTKKMPKMISQIGKSIEHDKPYIYVAETPLKVTVCRWKAVMLAVEMDAFNVCAMQTVIARSLGWRFASATTVWPKFVLFNRKWCGKSCSKRIFNSIRSPNGQMTHLASTIFLFLNVDWGQNRLCQSLVDMKHAPIAHTHTHTDIQTYGARRIICNLANTKIPTFRWVLIAHNTTGTSHTLTAAVNWHRALIWI